MTEEDVRALLLKRAKLFAGKRIGSSGVTRWCAAHGIAKSHVSDFLHGKRGPSTAMLNALSLEWSIVRKRKAQS